MPDLPGGMYVKAEDGTLVAVGAPGRTGPQGPTGEGVLLLEPGESVPEGTPAGQIVFQKVN